MLAIVWEYRARFAARARRPRQRPRGAALRAQSRRRVRARRRCWASRSASSIKAHLFAPVPVAVAFIVGAFVILWVERAPARAAGERARRRGRRHDDWLDALKVGIAQCVRADPRHVALGRHDHRRHAVRAVAQARPPSSRSSSPCRRWSPPARTRLWKNRALLDVGDLPVVRRRLRRVVRRRVPLRALADPLRRAPRLHAVRVVPDRLRRGGPRHRVDRRRAVATDGAGARRAGSGRCSR